METEPLCLDLQRPFFKLVFTSPFSPQLLKSICVPLSVLCILELLTFHGAALAVVLLLPVEVVLRPTCSSARSKRFPPAPLQFGALPNYHPMGWVWDPRDLAAFPRGCVPSLPTRWRTKQPAGSKPSLFTSQPDDMHVAKYNC